MPVKISLCTRYEDFKSNLSAFFALEQVESLAFTRITEWMVGPPRSFTEEEIKGGIKRMEGDSIIMVDDGVVYLV